MATQQQDLVFFDDNSLISTRSLDPENHALYIISHAEGTHPTWLINSLIENCLIGTANSVNRDLPQTPRARASATYVSFLHPRDFIVKSCRKQGLDLETADGFQFVDCFSELFSKQVADPGDSKAAVESVFDGIIEKLQASPRQSRVAIVHSPELLLAATDLSSNDLVHHLQRVNQNCNVLVVVANTDEAVVDLAASAPADPVYRITDFLVKLHHKSSLNVNLSPLATGKAKDITGSLTVSEGALPCHEKSQILEKEYVFHVSKEANVKVFFR